MKTSVSYQKVLELMMQLPAEQVESLLSEARKILQTDETQTGISEFRKFLLSAPRMTKDQYGNFLENRRKLNQWRAA
jgi:hypothetical protein